MKQRKVHMIDMLELRPAPARAMPLWCNLYGLRCSPMLTYCSYIELKDRVPRGLEKKLPKLRQKILNRIRGLT